MYEKIMYKVRGRNNKVIFRLQDFTLKDNVDESMFEEAKNSKGAKRLECKVIVLHAEEFEALQHKPLAMKEHVETLTARIKQQNNEINRLQKEIEKYERAHKDEEFNILLETRRLEKQHQNTVDELKETHINQVHAIDETHRKQLKKMRAHYTAKLDEVNEHLFESMKANDEEREKLRGEMLHMKQEHEQNVLALQKEHHLTVEKLQHEHSNELQTLREQHTYDLDGLKQTLSQIKQEHLIEINEMHEKHHVEVDEVRTRFARLLANEHAQDLSDFDDCGDFPLVVKLFARGFVKSFDEFKKRKYMNTPQKIVDSYEFEKLVNE